MLRPYSSIHPERQESHKNYVCIGNNLVKITAVLLVIIQYSYAVI
jgi:hypothetical protein